jgi:hypothetical protein
MSPICRRWSATSAVPREQRLSATAPADAAGTHAIFAAVIAGFSTGEVSLARRIVADLRPGMLCLAAFVGYSLWRDAAATGADLLWRARGIFVWSVWTMAPT